MPPINIAKFTTAGELNTVCQRCKVSYPEGTKLHFLQDAMGQGPGRYVCEGCRQHYFNKTQALITNERATFRQFSIAVIDEVLTHSQNLPIPGRLQRGTRSRLSHSRRSKKLLRQHNDKVGATIDSESMQEFEIHLGACEGQNHPVRMGDHVKRTAIPTSTSSLNHTPSTVPWPRRHSTPDLHHPGRRTAHKVAVPPFVSNPHFLGNYGYQEVHARYDEMRQFFAKKAVSTHQNEVATIKVTLMSMKPGNKSAQIVSVRIRQFIMYILMLSKRLTECF
jgi:hypothetical protein